MPASRTYQPVCQGCGGTLPTQVRGRPRIYCSARCRKAQYSTPCTQCGAPTSGSEGRRPDAICVPCAAELGRRVRTENSRRRRGLIATRWAEGATLKMIAAEFGMTGPQAVGAELAAMRAAGWEVPYRHAWSPASIAKVAAATRERRAAQRKVAA